MSYLTHLTVEGDTWDAIAYRYYGNAWRYPPIIAANPHVPITPVLPAGITLTIPVLPRRADATDTQSLPPWMR